MNIVVLTSKDHIYANFILKELFRSGSFHGHSVTVLEQDSLYPGKSTIAALTKYLKTAGLTYFIAQVVKQYLFLFARARAKASGDAAHEFYPYYEMAGIPVTRKLLNKIKSPEARKEISDLKPDLILSVLSKEIIPKSLIDLPKQGCFNLHPALLPSYRGVSPLFWCLAHNEKKTGTTLHAVVPAIDAGQIMSQVEIPIEKGTSEHALYLKCAAASIPLIQELLTSFSAASSFPACETARGTSPTTGSLPRKDTYFSLPTTSATRALRRNGFCFFRFSEFLNLPLTVRPTKIRDLT